MKVIIIGGVAGGASTAARLRRNDENARIIMFERGEHISYASCGLPYYLSDKINDKGKLVVMPPEQFKALMNIDVRIKSEVVKIDRANKKVIVMNNLSGETYEETYDKLVLSPGAKPYIPEIEGIHHENIFSVRTVNDAENIKQLMKNKSPQKALVIGGGFIGVEVAENLQESGIQTSIIEMGNQLLTQLDFEVAAQVHNHLRDNGVELHLATAVEGFEHRENSLIAKLNNGKTIEADFAVMAIGVRPENNLALDSGIEVGPRGHIVTNENMLTNDENIYALGDAVEVIDFNTKEKTAIPLAGPANKQGRIVADNIVGKKTKFNGTQGTSILKVFDYDVASTGLSEKVLKSKNIPYLKTFTHGFSHANYYPEAMPLMIKLLFSPERKILGAQVIGSDGVDKRIDVIATTLRMGGTIDNLAEAELAYAPPHGSAKDPVNIVAMSAQNIAEGSVEPVYTEDIQHLENVVFLDVRTNEERMLGNIDNDIHIPLEELRERLEELPKEKEIITYCTKGLKSYFASRVLKQKGFERTKSLNGGYYLYKQLIQNAQGNLVMNEQKNNANVKEDLKIDACGLSCPGPIMKLSKTMKELDEGKVVEISVTDAGFKSDVEAWASNTGNTVLTVEKENKIIKAKIQKGSGEIPSNESNTDTRNKTFVVFSNDLDKVMASFIIANGALAQGDNVSMFFTFWGLNALRKDEKIKVKKGLLDKMFGFMMPKGANNLSLSKMHMGGMGTQMMKYVMNQKNVPSLPELISQAQENGVKIIACQMAMDVMGIKKEELIDNIEIGGVAKYLNEADKSGTNLFI